MFRNLPIGRKLVVMLIVPIASLLFAGVAHPPVPRGKELALWPTSVSSPAESKPGVMRQETHARHENGRHRVGITANDSGSDNDWIEF